jgi:hypothetical protein
LVWRYFRQVVAAAYRYYRYETRPRQLYFSFSRDVRNGLKVGGIAGGLSGAFFLWLGFVATVTLVTKLYEKKPWGLWLLDNAFWLITMMLMGVILSVWP